VAARRKKTAAVKKPRVYLEHAEQCALMNWAAMKHFTHQVPDGRTIQLCLRDLFEASLNGAQLRGGKVQRVIQWREAEAAGAMKSASDLTLFYPVGVWHGMKIEMKKQRKDFPNPSSIRKAMKPGQAVHLHLMTRLGYHSIFCFGWVEAANAVSEYMGWPIPFNAAKFKTRFNH